MEPSDVERLLRRLSAVMTHQDRVNERIGAAIEDIRSAIVDMTVIAEETKIAIQQLGEHLVRGKENGR